MLVEFGPEAVIDYREAVVWYAKQSLDTANRFEDAVTVAITKIVAHPEQFHVIFAGCRRCSLRPFPLSLIFRCGPDRISIVAVAHASRDESYWHERL